MSQTVDKNTKEFGKHLCEDSSMIPEKAGFLVKHLFKT